jgi:hypothetical protein
LLPVKLTVNGAHPFGGFATNSAFSISISKSNLKTPSLQLLLLLVLLHAPGVVGKSSLLPQPAQTAW